MTVAISAHQGGGEHAPAGSWAAYQSALELGVDYVEFDVRRTRDGALVVYHDKRAEAAGLRPFELTRDELLAAAGGELPTLRDMLELLAGRAKAHIDVKEPGYESEVVTAALDVLGPNGFLVTGEDAVVAGVKRAAAGVRAALSLGRGPHEIPLSQLLRVRGSEWWPIRRVRACGADAVALHHRLARAGTLRTVARAGIPALIWTVNDPTLIRRFVHDPRVEVLVTERPKLALQERG